MCQGLTWRANMAALSKVTTPISTYHHHNFALSDLREMKKGHRVSVCIPARDEAATIGPIVECVRHELVGVGLVDELVVVDDRSSDATAFVARGAGARVVSTSGALGPRAGKGEAMRRGSMRATGTSWCSSMLTWSDSERTMSRVF